MAEPDRRWLGIDLGGTNIKAVVLDDGGAVVGRSQSASCAADGPDAVIAALGAVGRAAIDEHGPVAGAGLAVPGPFDPETGTIVLFPNLPGPWPGVPIVERVAAALDVPTTIINDARAFTLAEGRVGAARGCDTVAAYVLGTGIGGGVIVGGRLHFGRGGRAGELAHQVIVADGPPCGCGNRGCLEAVARSDVLTASAGQPTVDAVFAAAADGDARAADAISTMVGHLAHAIANTITVLVPERVVIGGGIATAGDALFAPLRAEVARRLTLVPPDWCEIVPAELGTYAGAIGAALWASESSLVDAGYCVTRPRAQR